MYKDPAITPKIYLIVTGRNVETKIARCLDSIRNQSYTIFECLVFNDASTDDTEAIIHQSVGDDSRFMLIHNKERVWATMARWKCLHRIKNASRNVLVVLLDGDDWLADERVLEFLMHNYFNKKYLAGHGNYRTSSGEYCDWSADYPIDIKATNAYRYHPWIATHLRWFRLGLRDFLPMSVILDSEGSPYKVATDFAFFLPLLELAGPWTIYTPDVLYIYDDEDNNKARRAQQLLTEQAIRKRPSLSAINIEYFALDIKP